MADNFIVEADASGTTFRTLDDGTNSWIPSVFAFATTVGTPDVIQIPTGDYLGDNTANPLTLMFGACGMLYDGSTWDRAPGSSADGALVNLGANNDVVVSGTIAATQSGTWTLGTITPGTTATSLGKAEDAAHSSGDVGVMSLAVRSNTAASTSGSDGDYQPLITNTTGHLWVDASGQTLTVGAHNVTNAGTFAVQATIASGATSIAKAEDAASADADVGVPAMAVRKATPANTSGTDGDYEFLQVSAGRLWCSVVVDTALPAGANVIGAVTQSGTWNIGTVTTVTTVAAVTAITNALPAGTNAIGKLAANSGVTIGAVEIAAAQTIAVTNAGTFVVQATIGAAAANIGKAEDAAHANADVGAFVLAVRKDSAASTATSDGDYTAFTTDNIGQLRVTVGSGSIDVTSVIAGVAATSLGKAEDAVHASGDTGVFVLAVRRDTAASTATTDGDYTAFTTDSTGRVWCNVSNTVTVTVGSSLPAGSAVIGQVGLTTTAGAGTLPYRSTGLTNTATTVKSAPGSVYGGQIYNGNTTDAFLQFYDLAAASVTVGTTTPKKSLRIPAKGHYELSWPVGRGFLTEITIAATTTMGGGTAPGTALEVNLDYA